MTANIQLPVGVTGSISKRELLKIKPGDVLARGKYKQTVKARDLLCYWGTRELGMTTVDLAKKLNLAQPTISQSAMRGQKTVVEAGLKLL